MDTNDQKGVKAIVGAVLIFLAFSSEFLPINDEYYYIQVIIMITLFIVGMRYVWRYMMSLSNSNQ